MRMLIKLAGVTFGDCQLNLALYKMGNPLHLQRVPENEFDYNAISVRDGSSHLGWIPKIVAAELAPRMDRGEVFHVTPVKINQAKKGTTLGMTVIVKDEDDEKLNHG